VRPRDDAPPRCRCRCRLRQFSGLIRSVDLVNIRNGKLGEFDGIDMVARRFVENFDGKQLPTPMALEDGISGCPIVGVLL
jgi:hypothetical protein